MITAPAAVLVADPPWKFGDSLVGPGRGASKHYNCMSLDELKAFPLPQLADDCYLFLWRVAAMMREAYAVCESWGFTAKTELVWTKRTKHGKRHFGMGRHVRAEHEGCIIATRGRPQRKVANIRSMFEAQVGQHSAKPDEFYEIVEGLCTGPYVELFARRKRDGWTCIGNEIPIEPETTTKPRKDETMGQTQAELPTLERPTIEAIDEKCAAHLKAAGAFNKAKDKAKTAKAAMKAIMSEHVDDLEEDSDGNHTYCYQDGDERDVFVLTHDDGLRVRRETKPQEEGPID